MIDYTCDCLECEQVFHRLKRNIKAIENLNEEEMKLQNNLEGHVNDDEEVKDQANRL